MVLVPVEVRVARLLVFLLLLGVEGPPVGAGGVVGGGGGTVAVGDRRRSVVICRVAGTVTGLLVLNMTLQTVSHQAHHLPSPSPCEARMFCRRRRLKKVLRSLRLGPRSCRMAGSSE